MKKALINQTTSLEDLATIVCSALYENGIEVILTGGAVVSIYSANEYRSFDLDFIVLGIGKRVVGAMTSLGFSKGPGRHFVHPGSLYYVEFPGGTVAIGNSLETEIVEKVSPLGILKLLSPTYCVKDRLAAYYHWNDLQALDQAVAVAQKHPISLKRVRDWSKAEGMTAKFADFESRFKSPS